ncbi:MAG: mannose-1-phosphate guanylyltransferase [Akkermansiaceae bacterium]
MNSTPTNSDNFALILAGGSGTRFWPLSRNAKPKQLLNLFGNTTLLTQTIDRLKGLIPLENILILTNPIQEEAVREVASQLPPENIFAEPAKRDTAPAVALGIALVAARNPNATMMVLPSDQLISDIDAYQSIMSDALTLAANNASLVTVGIKPTWPCPSFGYIERGSEIKPNGPKVSNQAYEVTRFREKPNSELAEKFLKQGNFAWNAGMFIWSIQTVVAELKAHSPELAQFIEIVQSAQDIESVVAERFLELTPTSIDYALMETASSVLNIEATFDWDDVGSWISLAAYLDEQGDGNKTNTEITEIESSDNIIFNDRKDSRIALLGVNDLIIVQTEDALLIANRHQADDIKALGKELPTNLL